MENNNSIVTIGDKIRSLISVSDGQSTSTFTEEEKQKSISKSDIFNTSYNEVDPNTGYDDSESAVNEVLESFKKASEDQGADPIIQNGFSERYDIEGTILDVGVIKCANACSNNATQGSYQTIKLDITVKQLNPDEVDTVDEMWDLDLSGKKIDINRPGKTALKDGHITAYLNKNKLSLSVTLPITGNDQVYFDKQFQNDVASMISYSLSLTLAEMVEAGIAIDELAKAEVRLTSRKAIEDIIRKEAKARYASSTDEEIEEIVDNVYPAVSEDLDIKPLTKKSITFNLQSNLVEKALRSSCEWTSTSDKWNFFTTDTHIMRYRPIASANQTVPLTDNAYDTIVPMSFELFKKFVNVCNDMLCDKLNLDKVNPVPAELSIPQHNSKLSAAIGLNTKELFLIRKDFKSEVKESISKRLDQRDENSKTKTMENLSIK